MFSNEQLQDLIQGKVVGEIFPYDTHNEREIEAHIRRLFYRINRIPNLVCEADWDHFGSGYASFVEFFCYQKKDAVVVKEKYGRREVQTEGIIIDICRLAPVAIIGTDERYDTINMETNEVVGGAHSSLLGGYQLLELDEKFQEMAEKIKKALQEFDYTVLNPEEVNEPLPFKTKIPTIYRNPGEYLILDAIFYWED